MSQPSQGATKAGDRIVWVDCEMTGLDLGSDALVEIACVVTDAELRELDAGVTVVIRPPDAPFEAMPDVVREMHTASGLLEEIPSGTTLEEAQRIVLDYVRSHVAEPRKAPLAGSSVYVDRGFISRDMPELDAWLHYRLIDVSSIKELVRRWYPRVYFNSPPKRGNHRALRSEHQLRWRDIEVVKQCRQRRAGTGSGLTQQPGRGGGLESLRYRGWSHDDKRVRADGAHPGRVDQPPTGRDRHEFGGGRGVPAALVTEADVLGVPGALAHQRVDQGALAHTAGAQQGDGAVGAGVPA